MATGSLVVPFATGTQRDKASYSYVGALSVLKSGAVVIVRVR